jgi:hypothetical protein
VNDNNALDTPIDAAHVLADLKAQVDTTLSGDAGSYSVEDLADFPLFVGPCARARPQSIGALRHLSANAVRFNVSHAYPTAGLIDGSARRFPDSHRSSI